MPTPPNVVPHVVAIYCADIGSVPNRPFGWAQTRRSTASLNGITIGTRWIEAIRLEPSHLERRRAGIDHPGVEGLYFGLTDDEAIGPEEQLMQLAIADIGVYDPAKGRTLPF